MRLHAPRLGKRSVTLLAFVVIAATTIFLPTRAAGASGPALITGTDSSAWGSMGPGKAGEYRTAYLGSVCLSEPGEVTIRSIEPVKPRGGLAVTDFAAIQGHVSLGASGGRLRDEPAYHGGRTVTATCSTQDYATLIVEMRKPRAADATAEEFQIAYDSDGDRRTARLRLGFGLCEQSHCGDA